MVEIRNLKSGEEDKLIETMYTIFSGGVAKSDYFRKHVMSEDIYNSSNVKVVVDNNKILSHVVIQEREIYIPNRTIKIGGIALVGTLESHRKRNYITTLLNYAIKDMKNRNYDASMLLTNNPYFRNKLWKPLQMEYIISPVNSGNLKTTTKNYNEIEDNLEKLIHLHSSFCKDKEYFVKRSESYWKNRLPNDYIFPKDNFLFFLDNDKIVGYAVYETKEDLIEIKEATWKEGYLDDIVIKASEIAQDSGLGKIGMFGPWLKKYGILNIINQIDRNLYKEYLMMLSLKDDLQNPKDPVLFWPNDHF